MYFNTVLSYVFFSYIIDGMSFMLSHIIDAMKYIKLIIDGYY